MSQKYFIPLQEIDNAIRVNCLIEKNSIKPLTLAKSNGLKNKGIGRCLFIFLAVRCGYESDQVCDYLCISSQEFEKKRQTSIEYYHHGRLVFLKGVTSIDLTDLRENSLFFYRKLLLISNYLKYRYNVEIVFK